MRTLVLVLRIGKKHLLAHVDGQLPAIGGMGLLDVDDEEIDAVTILAVERIEGGNLPPERRSSIAPEDQHDGLGGQPILEPHATLAVVGFEGEFRGFGTHRDRPAARDRP